MSNAPHLEDGLTALMGGIRRRKTVDAALQAATEIADTKQRHQVSIEQAKQEAYSNAMLDFMYASTIQKQRVAMEPDGMDLNTPLPSLG